MNCNRKTISACMAYFLQRNDNQCNKIYSFFRPHQGGSCKAAHQCKEGGAEVPEDK